MLESVKNELTYESALEFAVRIWRQAATGRLARPVLRVIENGAYECILTTGESVSELASGEDWFREVLVP
jgi:hypothetical protein